MQNPGPLRPPTNPYSSFRLSYTSSPAPVTPARGGTPIGSLSRDRFARESTASELDDDENAPPDPEKDFSDDLPPPTAKRMIGAFDGTSTAATTPRTSIIPLSPTRTMTGSVTGTPIAASSRKGRVLFRADPNMVTTFDKKVDGELYDLWTSK